MYTCLSVRNFRCFRKLDVRDLDRINLIAGLNNVGKTALLEALFIHCGAYNPELTLRVGALRGIELVKVEFGQWSEAPWNSLFAGFDASKPIEMVGRDSAGRQRTLRLKAAAKADELAPLREYRTPIAGSESLGEVPASVSSEAAPVLQMEYSEADQQGTSFMVFDRNGAKVYPPPPPAPFRTFFLSARGRAPLLEDAERFGKLVKDRKQAVLIEALKLVEPRLKDLALASENGLSIIHADIGAPRLIPLPLMGEGMVRLATLLLAIGSSAGGVVLVDEIENGLHYSILGKVWLVLGKAAKLFNTQLFATTHSWECIVAAHKAFAEAEAYELRTHRLDRKDEETRVVTYDQETLEAAVESGMEIRH